MEQGKVLADVVFAARRGHALIAHPALAQRDALNNDDVVTSQRRYAAAAVRRARSPASRRRVEADDAGADLAQLDAGRPHHRHAVRASRRPRASSPAASHAARASACRANSRPHSPKASRSRRSAARPEEEGRAEGRGAKPTPSLEGIGEDNTVVLVADIDMLADSAAVEVQEVFGQSIIVPLERQSRLRAEPGRAVRRRRRADQPAQPRRLPAADGGARNADACAAAVPRQDQGARGQPAADEGEAAGRCRSRAAAPQAPIMTPEQQTEIENFKKATETRKRSEGTAQEPAPGNRVARVLDQAGQHRAVPLLVVLVGLALAVSRRRKVGRKSTANPF